jgi:uncharacterized Zn-binding protein involved in type VI secretion
VENKPMKDAEGREMARLGDKTDHGGDVVQASLDMTHMGIPVALDGHLVACKICSGVYPIIATGKFLHRGVRVAYIGDKTACGATLISA